MISSINTSQEAEKPGYMKPSPKKNEPETSSKDMLDADLQSNSPNKSRSNPVRNPKSTTTDSRASTKRVPSRKIDTVHKRGTRHSNSRSVSIEEEQAKLSDSTSSIEALPRKDKSFFYRLDEPRRGSLEDAHIDEVRRRSIQGRSDRSRDYVSSITDSDRLLKSQVIVAGSVRHTYLNLQWI